MNLGGLGDQLKNHADEIKAKATEAAGKLVDSKLDGDMADKVKNVVDQGVDKGVDLIADKLDGENN